MPPKKGKGELPPCPPPEADPEEQLPEDVRNLTEPPFPVSWHPLVTLFEISPGISAEQYKATLTRRQLARAVHVNDLFLRMDPTSQLSTDIREAYDAHAAGGGEWENFALTPESSASILKQRFERDKTTDWKFEFLRRNKELKMREGEAQAANEAVTSANTVLAAAVARVQKWRAEVAAAKAEEEAEEDGLEESGPAGIEGVKYLDGDNGEEEEAQEELSPEEEGEKEATATLAACELRAKDLAQTLAEAHEAIEKTFICYKVYWVEGLSSNLEELEQVAAAGVSLRAAVWGHTPPSADSLAPPALYTSFKGACDAAGWSSTFSGCVALDIELPCSVEPIANDPEDKKAAAAAAAAPKKGKEEPPPPATTTDAPGWGPLAQLLEELTLRAQSYDAWREKVKVHSASAPSVTAMSHYERMLKGVAPERITIPVLVHAMLEQVARNVQGEEANVEGEQAAAESCALSALSRAFEAFEAADRGEVFAGLADGDDTVEESLLNQGDDLAAASAGLTTGLVHSIKGHRSSSPLSPLEGASRDSFIGSEESEGVVGAAMGETERMMIQEGTEETYDSISSYYIPGIRDLDIDEVDAHMLSVMTLPGFDDPAVTVHEHAKDSFQVAHRSSVLTAAVQLLPPSARVAHGSEVLQRRHVEQLLPVVAKQVVSSAALELPHCSSSWCESAGGVVLACFAGSYEQRAGGGLPVAITFSTYWERVSQAVAAAAAAAAAAAEIANGEEGQEGAPSSGRGDFPTMSTAETSREPLNMPSLVYEIVPELRESAEQGTVRKYQYGPDGTILSTGGAAPALITKGGTTVLLSSAGGEGQAHMVATLPGGSAVSIYHHPSLPLPASPSPETPAAENAEEECAAAARAPAPDVVSVATPAGQIDTEVDIVPPKTKSSFTSIQVCTPAGAAIDIDTQGSVTMIHQEAFALEPHGANDGGMTVAVQKTVTSDGALVTLFSDGGVRVLHIDGSVSERASSVEGWINPLDGSDARGWIRTKAEGTRYIEPDEGSVPRPPPRPPTPPPEPEETDPKKIAAAAKAAKEAGKASKGAPPVEPERPPTPPPPPPPPPRQTALPAWLSAVLTDPETGAKVLIREDLLMCITYPSGQQLLLDGESTTRLSRLPNGNWAVELGGALPAVFGDGEGNVQVCPAPGIQLSASSGSRTATCVLPDGSSLLAGIALAAYAPESLVVDASALSSHPASYPSATPVSLAETKEWRGAVLLDLVTGQAAMAGPQSETNTQIPLSFRLGPGCQEVLQWPEPLPLSWVEYPEPSPPEPEVNEDEDGGDLEDEGRDEENEDGQGDIRRSSLTYDTNQGMEGEDDEEANSQAPGTKQPEPVHHFNPLAPAVSPRVFLLFHKSGDCYELLSEGAAVASKKATRSWPAPVVLPPPLEPPSDAALVQALLWSLAPVPAVMDPLPASQHTSALPYPYLRPTPALTSDINLSESKRKPLDHTLCTDDFFLPVVHRISSQLKPDLPVAPLDKLAPPQEQGGYYSRDSKPWQYVPAVTGYQPPQQPSSSVLPVLLYREILEYPQLPDALLEKLQGLMSEGQTAQDDVADVSAASRPDDSSMVLNDSEEASSPQEKISMVLKMRQMRAARGNAAREDVLRLRKNAEGEDLFAEHDDLAACASEAMMSEKILTAWAPKVGPFDHTVKRPGAGQPLNFWQAEEGILARENDSDLQMPSGTLTRNTLPSRQPQSSFATPGAPSTLYPGVYVSEKARQLAEAEAQLLAEERAAAQVEEERQGRRATFVDDLDPGSPFQQPPTTGLDVVDSPRGWGGTTNKPVDYSYPELAHTAILEQQATLKNSSLKTHRLDVYGQPRALLPQLPASYISDEAHTTLNERYLAAEGGPLRDTKTSSASLIKLAGKADRQFLLKPGHIHFGDVQVGTVVHNTARLRNVSGAVARYSVARPELPLRVIHKPGPLAAGMESVLTVELAAPSTPGNFVGEVVIKSELNILVLTVSARVVTANGLPLGPLGTENSGGLPLSPVREVSNSSMESQVAKPNSSTVPPVVAASRASGSPASPGKSLGAVSRQGSRQNSRQGSMQGSRQGSRGVQGSGLSANFTEPILDFELDENKTLEEILAKEDKGGECDE